MLDISNTSFQQLVDQTPHFAMRWQLRWTSSASEHGFLLRSAAGVLDNVTPNTLWLLLNLFVAWTSHTRPLKSLSEPVFTYFQTHGADLGRVTAVTADLTVLTVSNTSFPCGVGHPI